MLSQACSVSETAKQRRAVRTVRLLRHALEKRTHFSYGPGSLRVKGAGSRHACGGESRYNTTVNLCCRGPVSVITIPPAHLLQPVLCVENKRQSILISSASPVQTRSLHHHFNQLISIPFVCTGSSLAQHSKRHLALSIGLQSLRSTSIAGVTSSSHIQ